MNHDAILETHESFGESIAIADPARIVDLCRYLKSEEKYIRLSAVTAVDWHPAEPRFEVVYHLHSIERNAEKSCSPSSACAAVRMASTSSGR